ncbi:hypothetical protein [Dyadobacter sediminis]|uniref:Uncharacterized protein n=1 Tax=Dyadobacter sediminis TaxID=1493691 RepID=A0A5R9KJX9_9BACT|nr:hypothetical protein [Dyadobacter sediminis]TLU96512.1 hypothetical protein FEM55_05100 [Dyadobacter sediminis]GGB82819.1 hypothetical protein GCM10011325_07970 [Dyadobacter sediminis]
MYPKATQIEIETVRILFRRFIRNRCSQKEIAQALVFLQSAEGREMYAELMDQEFMKREFDEEYFSNRHIKRQFAALERKIDKTARESYVNTGLN